MANVGRNHVSCHGGVEPVPERNVLGQSALEGDVGEPVEAGKLSLGVEFRVAGTVLHHVDRRLKPEDFAERTGCDSRNFHAEVAGRVGVVARGRCCGNGG
jgi:hypothetical protein